MEINIFEVVIGMVVKNYDFMKLVGFIVVVFLGVVLGILFEKTRGDVAIFEEEWTVF